MSSVPPSSGFCLGGGPESACFASLSAFLHLCAGLLLCCDCSVQVSRPKCDMAIVCPLGERRAVFSHTLLARVQAQKAARTRESVDAQQRTWAMENLLDFLNSAGSPHDNKSFILFSVVLSGKRKNPNNSAKGQGCLFHYCLMKISPGYVSKHMLRPYQANKIILNNPTAQKHF